MSSYAYRIDALAANKRAGETGFLLATSKAAALRVFQETRPHMVGWTFEVTKIAKEEMPVSVELPVLELSDFNDELVLDTLLALRSEGVERPVLLTQYPWDVVDGDTDTRDTVILGRHDEACVVDKGDPTTEEGEPA